MHRLTMLAVVVCIGALVATCTQEQQNRVSRSVQNITGVDGVLDIISEGKIMYRFIKIDKMSTATATSGQDSRPYRYGHGILDLNQNYKKDEGEKMLYFEVSDYGTNYVFYANPQ